MTVNTAAAGTAKPKLDFSKLTKPDPAADPFAAASGIVKITDYEGRLLLIKPLSVQHGIATSTGVVDAISANVVVLDDPEGEDIVQRGMLVFQKVLRARLEPFIGDPKLPYGCLGRLLRGTAKPGQSAPWILGSPDDDDKVVARAYIKKVEATQQDPFA